ncbi:DUF4159 domain-containing protein [Colwellia sp. 4_MG-2023]|uniref:DUF4159 domain-containing protein n=1 Tax=unclassified Colwellia TaxID=196834 RepID=UPI0026E273EA|nr:MULTISPECIES: DUF4159 domain-containing protein [unclassified Colwellia]MDO6507051.1 DUF4159 domain-containing protein [Colwellia sp. 5_MG-2023]MDO6555903.1 DUF4159 domain-containing protein [Colwellia sp. 4_MG-2023]
MNRRYFLKSLSALTGITALGKVPLVLSAPYFDFYFTRLSYESGDWEVDERMPANVLNSLIEYTSLRVDIKERIVPLSDPIMLTAPFCYLAGHRLVQFNHEEKQNFKRYVENGGFVFVDDCNHDIDGMFARSFEQQMREIFGENSLNKIPNDHAIYSSFFKFDGPPRTSIELNGWGDDLVHDYLKAIEVDGRIGVLYSNKDLGCEWDYDFRNKRWLKVDNTRFAVNIVMYAMTA